MSRQHITTTGIQRLQDINDFWESLTSQRVIGKKIKYSVGIRRAPGAVWSSRFHKQLLLTITAWAILATLILLNTQLWAEGAPRNFPLDPNTFYFLSMTSCATFSERICWLFSGTEVARTLFVSSALLLVLAFVGQSHHLGLSCCQHHLIFAYCSVKSTSTCN